MGPTLEAPLLRTSKRSEKGSAAAVARRRWARRRWGRRRWGRGRWGRRRWGPPRRVLPNACTLACPLIGVFQFFSIGLYATGRPGNLRSSALNFSIAILPLIQQGDGYADTESINGIAVRLAGDSSSREGQFAALGTLFVSRSPNRSLPREIMAMAMAQSRPIWLMWSIDMPVGTICRVGAPIEGHSLTGSYRPDPAPDSPVCKRIA